MDNQSRLRAFPSAGSTLTTVLLIVVVIAVLYFAREVLVPIALAVLLSFVLAPLARFFGLGICRDLSASFCLC